MGEIKVSVKREKENSYQFDIRMGGIRTRPTIECTEESALLIQKQLSFVNENPELFNVDEPLILSEFISRIYGLYGENASISQGNELINATISETTKILRVLIKKTSIVRKSPVGELMIKAKCTFSTFIRLLFLGQFGTGKSTIVKKLSNIPDDVDFPVVDTARTTIHDTHYIFKDKDLYKEFTFSVDFKPNFEIFRLVSECYTRAVDKIFIGIQENKSKNEIRDKSMMDFVSDPDKIFKIEYVLGKYYEIDNSKRNLEDKLLQIKFWDKTFEDIYTMIINFVIDNVQGFSDKSENNIAIEKNIRDLFLKDENLKGELGNLVWGVVEILEEKIKIICSELEQNGMGNMVKDGNYIVGFKNDNYIIERMEEYVTPFSSTSIKNFTNIITPLVQSIAIEIPYNEKLSKANKSKVICITDTVGFEHRKTDDTGSLEGSTNYIYNNYDIIGIVDSAKQSMNGTTENILREIYNNADKSKVMLMYTFYDDFTKKDFEDDIDKNNFLIDIQNTTFRKIDATESVHNFISSIQKNTLFLKGLMLNDNRCIDKLLTSIQDHFINLYDYKTFILKDTKKPIMAFNYKRLALVFSKAQDDFIKQQTNLYLQNYTHYKTTEALTNRLSNGQTYFSGVTKTLKPVDDFCSILMSKIELFIKNPDNINFYIKTTIPNHSERVIDWLKEEISGNLKIIVKRIFVETRTKTWYNLYMDGDSGVDYRRRTGILKELNNILPELDIEYTTFADRWIDEIESIFEKVLNDMKNY
ncbi:hypothetical protein [Clostridium vincentii]|uniref:Uncharacterized protein n=1 Tax=Clostridium vincentii TaxID=52704 RepID=A0A2T0BKZ3_9CLOT|nr:hypothetical protein [Clostridium vincentii]PRR84558.1 hypothetical protein CLVI_00810 [Clostridium vincentii]